MLALIHSLEYSKVLAVLLTVCLLFFFQAKWTTVPVEDPCFDDITEVPFEGSCSATVRDAEAEIEMQFMVADILPKSSRHSVIIRVASFLPQKLLSFWRVPHFFHVRHVFIPTRKEDTLPAAWNGQLDADTSDDQAWETAGSIIATPLVLSPAIDRSGEVRLDYFALSPAVEASADMRMDYFAPSPAAVDTSAEMRVDYFSSDFVLYPPQNTPVAATEGTVLYAPTEVTLNTHAISHMHKTPSVAALDHYMITGYGAWCELDSSLELLSADAEPCARELEVFRKLRALEERFPCLKDM